MILRMTFAARIGLIVVVGLGMAWISTIALYYIARAHTAENNTLPVPGHIAALVELIERTPGEERKLVLRVASSETFAARIDAGANTGTTAQRILPRLNQRAIESSLQALGGRPVSVNFADTGERRRLFSRLVPPTVDVRVGLRTGDTLVIEVGNAILLGPLGLPVGFGAGIFGTLIALLALLVMHRETKPLARLAEAVDRVDLSLDPVALPEARRSAPEIRSLIDAFNRLQGRLGELLRSRMAMLGGISHDVRTYATRLRLRAEKINDEAERDRAIADINDMILLLDDALLASRAGAGELAEEMVEIDDIIRAEVADRRSGGARIDYQGGHWEQVPIVLGDRLALRRVVANLADNAIKYGGSAHLRSMIVGKDFLLTVDDEGAGIPPEHRQAMLEPFSRLETSRSRGTGGAGLGLAIARGLTEAHGGALSIQQAPSGGARISVRLRLFQSR
ncbi:MAG TPA: ATP-binding protein [Bradyrhizobium sp.]|jgi:signal transduction histidine kinase|nr:ATP-binding protein [Bradyrhizobium sp.]